MKTNVFCALDFKNGEQAWAFYQRLRSFHSYFKIGLELFSKEGSGIVRKLTEDGAKVFLDLKFHDIPHTVARAVSQVSEWGVGWVSVHIGGGEKMVRSAREALQKLPNRPKLLGVTLLTSLSLEDLKIMGVERSIEDQVCALAMAGKRWGLDGVVCSGHELPIIRKNFDRDFITVVPGIRSSRSMDDQKRVVTPEEASRGGAHFFVMGRPLYTSSDPVAELQRILGRL